MFGIFVDLAYLPSGPQTDLRNLGFPLLPQGPVGREVGEGSCG